MTPELTLGNHLVSRNRVNLQMVVLLPYAAFLTVIFTLNHMLVTCWSQAGHMLGDMA